MEINNSELMSMDEKWKIIFSEQTRAPLFAVGHYITYLKKHVENEKGHKQKTKKLKDGIHPLSYLLRKLKLDLKMSYESFVSEFIKTPNNGLHLLIKLLRQLQNTSRQKSASVASKESRLEEFKRQLADEHDCLLCIKFTLRCQSAVGILVGEMDHLQIISSSLLSNTIKSRVVTLEIMTLSLSVPDGFDRVFETFTYMRLKFGESVRFKLLISMLFTHGYGQIVFQVSAMRFLNTLIAASGSGNLKVYLQQELEMAGLDIDILSKFTRGDGLEFDDLRREVEEWKFRYIDVDSLLKKPKPDVWSKEERPRFSDQDSRLTPNTHQDDQVIPPNTYQDNQVIPPKPYPNASRELPPVPNFTEIPANSLQLLMSLIHQQKQEAKNDIMQALNDSRRNSNDDDDDDDMTSDYNTDQELYIAHVYKNTDDCFSDSSKDNTLLNLDQIRRHSEGMVLLRKNRVPDNENIYETLNTHPSTVRTKELIDPCGLEVQKRRASVKTLGSLNGNWVLKSHLSMPSLNTIERPTSEIRGDGSGASDGKPNRYPVILTERVGQPDGADRSPRTPPEPEPDYSPDVTPNGTMAKCNSEAIKLLNDFDKMLDQHEAKPKTRSSREPDYIPSGTITFV
ncbi:uncharacterized protein LOC126809808 [Patella vulgata]|uniref:uncharacterized protein LOC126809808 n=1 Tax=Patella vulgata TaxID=6465 RepID=UPI00217FE68D|nr:uncharacterized protein LOC126809808 [Patella vulgata]